MRRNVGRLRSRIARMANGIGFADGRRALRCGVLPCAVHQPLLRALDATLVIDIGSNRGQFSLDVARALPAAKVLAFEPQESEARIYREIFADRPGYQLREVAIGRTSGSATLHVAAARDSTSLLPIGPRQAEIFPNTHQVGTQKVRVRTLDEECTELDLAEERPLLKLDVQGAELEALAGATRCLEQVDWVYAEVSFVELYDGQPLASEVIDHLAARGFMLVHVGVPRFYRGRSVQVDALFAGRSHLGGTG